MDTDLLYSDEDIARICWEANTALMWVNEDQHADGPWSDVSEAVRASCIRDVHLARHGNTTPQAMHKEWCERKYAQGWVWGPVRDAVAKTHPSLVARYEDVPAKERAKDYLWLAIIAALASLR